MARRVTEDLIQIYKTTLVYRYVLDGIGLKEKKYEIIHTKLPELIQPPGYVYFEYLDLYEILHRFSLEHLAYSTTEPYNAD
jgi:hypothetical protein